VLGTSWPPSRLAAAPAARLAGRRAAGRKGTRRSCPPAGQVPAGGLGWLDLGWLLVWLAGLAAILVFERWEAIPFHLIWVSFALLYGFRVRRAAPTFWVLAAMVVTTFAAIAVDVARHAQPADELNEVPLMAAMAWIMMWHARRRHAADAESARVSQENTRLLSAQVRFLQDASHQLRTPITVALGHAELLARSVAGRAGQGDVSVVVGELNRLRSLSERLLLIAASENPEFLRRAPVALDELAAEVMWRWRATATRRWQLGPLHQATVAADAERLTQALDALLENAIQHTGPDDMIRLSVERPFRSPVAGLVVQDSGSGIPETEVAHVFDRFRTGSGPGTHAGTGLGLALVMAVARGHGGEVRVSSAPGAGSRFELLLPRGAARDGAAGPAAGPAATRAPAVTRAPAAMSVPAVTRWRQR
jgi:signal transduction histidine kinase